MLAGSGQSEGTGLRGPTRAPVARRGREPLFWEVKIKMRGFSMSYRVNFSESRKVEVQLRRKVFYALRE